MADLPLTPSSRAVISVALAALLALGIAPHLYVLSLAPVSRDDVVWITRGAVTTPGWATWVFASEHFVGFRPVTALSYTLDSVLGGFDVRVYRATDLLLHLICAGLLVAVHRRAVERPAWTALIPPAALLLHPVSGLVVPHLARRAYPLATIGSLLGLWVLLGAPSRWRPWVAAGLLAFGALANEAAYVAVPVAALLVGVREGPGAAARTVGPAVGLGGVLVVHRLVLLGGTGGYAVEGGARWLPIVSSTWSGLLALDLLRSEIDPVPAVVAAGVGFGVLAALVGGTVRNDGPGRVAAVWWAWLLGLVLVYAPQGVFFPRQLYVALAPFALLLGLASATAATSSGWRRGVLVGALATVGAALLRQSPVLRGADPVQVAGWRAHDALVRDLVDDLADLPANAALTAVIPYHRRPDMEALRAHDDEDARRVGGRQALLWVTARTGVRFASSTLVKTDPRTDGTIGRLADGPVVVLAPGFEVASAGDATIDLTPAGTVVRPERPGREGKAPFLYFHDGTAGTLVPMEPR